MKRVKVLCLLLAVVFCFVFVGCDKETTSQTTSTVSTASGNAVQSEHKVLKTEKKIGFQLEKPEVGEKVAVLSTNYGDVYIRLFPDEAPKAVENFIGLIEKGYYNGLIFHRVINGFMIQGGDPTGTGTAGESIWGKDFEDEFCSELLNVRYSLAMANSGVATNGSQFFINQAPATSFDDSNYKIETFESAYQQYVSQYGSAQFSNVDDYIDAIMQQYEGQMSDPRKIPEEVLAFYKQQGGNIHLDGAWRSKGGHTVFGQVYQGMDVVDKIAAVETDSSDKPVKDVVIESAKVITVS